MNKFEIENSPSSKVGPKPLKQQKTKNELTQIKVFLISAFVTLLKSSEIFTLLITRHFSTCYFILIAP